MHMVMSVRHNVNCARFVENRFVQHIFWEECPDYQHNVRSTYCQGLRIVQKNILPTLTITYVLIRHPWLNTNSTQRSELQGYCVKDIHHKSIKVTFCEPMRRKISWSLKWSLGILNKNITYLLHIYSHLTLIFKMILIKASSNNLVNGNEKYCSLMAISCVSHRLLV